MNEMSREGLMRGINEREGLILSEFKCRRCYYFISFNISLQTSIYWKKFIFLFIYLLTDFETNKQTTGIKTMKIKTRLILDHRKLLMVPLLNSGAR